MPFILFSQVTENAVTGIEQQLENTTANNEDVETEDDTYLQQMLQFIRHPVNLNTAGEDELRTLQLLSPIQIQNCILYRNLLGKFISIYELQAIPTWNTTLIKKILPYIMVSNNEDMLVALKYRLKGGGHTIIARISQTLEKSKGYLPDTATALNFYPGSPQKILLRYKYQFKELLQYGITAEKDAGEQFFKGKQQQGFDFYSAHFFARNMGVIKSLALGDFTVNLGQGLTQWQSLAFKKSVAVLNINREGPVLRPYNSAGETNFHRGTGITVSIKKWEATFFVSFRKTDANLVSDTLQSMENFISSLQTSGYHRTKSETDDKGVQHQLAFGANASFRYKNLHLGINAIQYKCRFSLNKKNDPYNLFALQGSAFGNYSIDYRDTYKNLHWFGEAAIDNKLNRAYINGLLISITPAVDMSLLFRNIAPGYQSLYTNAFTENTFPTNENGIYAGLSVHPVDKWQWDAYADFYRFPWLRYRVDAPSAGTDYLMQFTFKPNKQLEIFSRFRAETKGINFNPGQLTLVPVVAQPKLNWRTQFSYKINPVITIKSRTEIIWYAAHTAQKEQGFSGFLDLSCKPPMQSWSASLRLQYFETDSYNSRIYAYENDVLFSYSIPAFYGKGIRYYVNGNYDINKRLSIWLRFAQTVYAGKTVIGSGLDEIKGSRKTEIKLQMLYKL